MSKINKKVLDFWININKNPEKVKKVPANLPIEVLQDLSRRKNIPEKIKLIIQRILLEKKTQKSG